MVNAVLTSVRVFETVALVFTLGSGPVRVIKPNEEGAKSGAFRGGMCLTQKVL